ncbi:MAG: tetratricopeptide repeat protein, partial [Planctomycetota bacterium]
MWADYDEVDPFINISKSELKDLLESGTRLLRNSLLGPEIQRIDENNGAERFAVVCSRATIEELLSRFATNTGHDISWVFTDSVETDSLQRVRNRPVRLYMPQATEYQFMIEAAGSAGLIARVNENSGSGEVAVYNPQQYTSLSEHVELISQQAIDLWRSFLLTYHSDARNANVHLALGLLMFGIDQPIEAIAEFKLVANRYAQSSAAPFALLHSSR